MGTATRQLQRCHGSHTSSAETPKFKPGSAKKSTPSNPTSSTSTWKTWQTARILTVSFKRPCVSIHLCAISLHRPPASNTTQLTDSRSHPAASAKPHPKASRSPTAPISPATSSSTCPSTASSATPATSPHPSRSCPNDGPTSNLTPLSINVHTCRS